MSWIQNPVEFLKSLFDRAVAVADPMTTLRHFLPERPVGRVVVVGAGKASARMAEAIENYWGPCEGIVLTRYGYSRACRGIKIIEAAHPVSDISGVEGTIEILKLLSGLEEGDFVVCLISGGASALLVAPRDEITLDDLQILNKLLLNSGTPISSINTLRKHLSKVKGGQLAAIAYPAQMLCLMISDVPGDDPGYIGSGPTVGETSKPKDALGLLSQWNIAAPSSISLALSGSSLVVPPDDVRLSRVVNQICAAPIQSLNAAAELGRSFGCAVELLGDALEGEAREVGLSQANLALGLKANMKIGDPPILLLSGGELTVTHQGSGSGGPNSEFSLSLALGLQGADGINAIACDTDGVDGTLDVAGAIITPDTLSIAGMRGIDPRVSLLNNDSHNFFEAVGGQVVTGPTLTNVNDFRAVLIQSLFI